MAKSVAVIGTRGYPSYYGGFETAIRRLAPFLADAGWDVTVYGRRRSTNSTDPNQDPRVRTIVTPGLERRTLSTLSYGLTASLHAAVKKPDVVLVMNVANGFWLPFFKIRNIPTVVNVDGMEWERAKWGKAAKLLFRVGARFTASLATMLIADSREIQRRWAMQFGRNSKFIAYGGTSPRSETAIESGLQHRRYVLAVARFVPENTMPEFFDAIESIAPQHPVVIVGSSGYGGDMEMRARELSESYANVFWLGHISDDERLSSLWEHAGAYFHGHSVGGTNPALVQAMASAAPIVARDTVYNREVLDDAAVFFEPEPQDISNKLLNLLSDKEAQDRFGEKAQARANTYYAWDDICRQYEALLSNLADNGHTEREA